MEREEDTTTSHSSTPDLSCQPCRRRKAKCDRKIPSCSLCLKSGQTCTYPSKRHRPGPKTGTELSTPLPLVFWAIANRIVACRLGSRLKKPRLSKRKKEDYAGSDRLAGHETASTEQRVEGISICTEDDHSMSSDGPSTGTFTMPQPFVPLKRPLSPETTVTTGVTTSNQPDTVPDPSYFALDYHQSSANQFSGPRDWDPLATEPQSGRDIISLPLCNSDAMLHTCHALNITPNLLQRLIDSYFANMTSFSLFHEPTFNEKLRLAGPSLYLNALLASMCSFSARFEDQAMDQTPHNPINESPSEVPCPDHFHQLALRFEEESLTQCADETPPLEFLQSIILTTFFQLTKGAHGRAWRWLGTCIRVAYELKIHCVDANKPDKYVPSTPDEIAAWSDEEERRRAWWAIWEMDTFASTLRGVPTGLNWSQSRTYLPVEDRLWFQQKFHPSCLLASKPGDRWKVLQQSRNESSTAWLIVVTSLMRTAQTISNLEAFLDGTPYTNLAASSGTCTTANGEGTSNGVEDELNIISHALQCTLLTLPDSLQYRDELLTFAAVERSQGPVHRKLHHTKYSIYVLAQLTRFMICHYYTFNKSDQPSTPSKPPVDLDSFEASRHPGAGLVCTTRRPNADGLKRYVEASDNIVLLLNRCSSTHVRYVNPFLATSIWLAAAVQLVNKKFGPSDSNRELAEGKFNVLRLTYKQFVRFWNTPVGLLQVLDSLEDRLDDLLHPERRAEADGRRASTLQPRPQGQSRRIHETSAVSGESTGHRPPPSSYMSNQTEPNLTGSGVNPMMGSSVVDGEHAGLPNGMEHPVLDVHSGSTAEISAMSHSGHVPSSAHFDAAAPTNQPMEPMGFAMSFDYDADADISLYLNGLLSGSYGNSVGPLG